MAAARSTGALGNEALELLRADLRIDTTKPPGNDLDG